jgi:thiol-disulfide isomerase/thioredoxin
MKTLSALVLICIALCAWNTALLTRSTYQNHINIQNESPQVFSSESYSAPAPISSPLRPQLHDRDQVPFMPDLQSNLSSLSNGVQHTRLIYRVAREPFSLSEVVHPGYYTLVIFSAEWCGPCHGMWNKDIPPRIARYPNLVAVHVDTTAMYDQNRARPEATKFFNTFGFQGSPPFAVLINPFGAAMDFETGREPIINMLDKRLSDRAYHEPLTLKGLVTLK